MSKEKMNEIKEQVAVVKSKSFNDIITSYQRIAWELENGEVTDEILEDLQANEKDAETKLLGMYYVIQMNTSKIDNFYKLQIESNMAKIKRLNKSNGILKEKCMVIAESYGKNNKYTSLELNCSKVTKEVIAIDDEVYDERVTEIKDVIKGLREDDITVDEFNCFSSDFTIKDLDIADAIKLHKLLDEHFNIKDVESRPTEIMFNLSLDKRKALELIKAIPEDDAIPVSMFDANEEPIVLGLKGVSKGYTYFPRFS